MISSDVHISNNIVIFCRQYRGLSKIKELEILLENTTHYFYILGNLVGVNYKIISRVWKVRPALVGLEYN
jgi:hypothetical protein